MTPDQSLPWRQVGRPPTPIEVPAGVKTYVHGTCESAWLAPLCACGQYRLSWPGSASHAILQMPLVGDHRGVIRILAEAIDGPYDFSHQALQPWVTVWPTGDGGITVRATPWLFLHGGAQQRSLFGSESMRLAVMFGRRGEESLMEMSAPPYTCTPPLKDVRSREVPPRHRRQPSAPQAPAPKPTPQALVVAPEPTPEVPSLPRARIEAALAWLSEEDVSPAVQALEALRVEADVQPLAGDYLIVPEGHVDEAEVSWLPWVQRSPHVDRVHVHKPRLERERP
jgi:hypothetical protein